MKLIIFENRRRVSDLYNFRKLVIDYFENIQLHDLTLHTIEKPKAAEIRPKINLVLNRIQEIISSSGVSPIINYREPISLGGSSSNVNLFYNIFRLNQLQIDSKYLIDYIDTAIGIYEDDKVKAIVRTFNPLFWLMVVLDYTVSLPFIFLGRIGFNQTRIESSVSGKLVKGVLYLIGGVASFLTVLEKLGLLDKFKLATIGK